MNPSATRRGFLAGTGGLLATGLAIGSAEVAAATTAQAQATAPAAAPPRRPNFVIFLADDLGYGELGCYGQRKIRTPNLDRLAQEGMRFTDAYAGAPVCAPSRASLLTGLHSGHSSVRTNPGPGESQGALTDTDLTFAELLRAAGYRTACIGKWGFGPENPAHPSFPHARGFDEFFGFIGHRHAHQYWPTHLWRNTKKVRSRGYAPDLFLAEAVRFLKEAAGGPFLLYYSTTLPHAPNQAPDLAPYENKPWRKAEKQHAAQVTRLDRHVGTLIRTLRRLGLDRSTVVLFAGDNGPHEEKGFNPDFFQANGGLRGYKRNLYEGGIRVPMIAWGPGIIPAGRISRTPVAFYDVLPTLADLAGVPAPADVDGRSFRRVLTGGSGGDRGPLYWVRSDHYPTARANAVDAQRGRCFAEAVRRGRWKAVRFAPGAERAASDAEWRLELYDLDADPRERTDLAAARPELAAELAAVMNAAWSDGPYARTPYGLRLEPVSGGIAVTLWNGSRTTWRDVHITAQGREPTGKGTRLKPGEGLRVEFDTRGVSRFVATAWFTVNGRTLRLQKVHALPDESPV